MAVDPARLESVALFAELTDGQRAAVAEKFEERHLDAGEHLSREGGTGYFFFVIDSGSAKVTRGNEVLAEFGAGDFFGEAAIFKTRRRTATVTTSSPTTIFAMFGADFAKLVAEMPSLHSKIDAALRDRVPE
jgi:CRP-like cAMP-binding protein